MGARGVMMVCGGGLTDHDGAPSLVDMISPWTLAAATRWIKFMTMVVSLRHWSR